MHTRQLILITTLILWSLIGNAQQQERLKIFTYSSQGKKEQNRIPVPERFNTFSYGVNEGLLQSSLNDIAFDKNNFCWISFPNGIQTFDGKNFRLVPVQDGLPDDKWVNFFRTSNGDLLISHSLGISKYDIERNRFRIIYTNPRNETQPAIFIGESRNIIYIYGISGLITGLENKHYSLVSKSNPGFGDYSRASQNRPRISSNIINDRVSFHVDDHLYLWDLRRGKLLYQSDPVPFLAGTPLTLKNESQLYCYEYQGANSFSVYDFANKRLTKLLETHFDSKRSFRSNIYSWKGRPVISMYNKLFEADSGFHTIKAELVNFQNQSIAGSSSISKLIEDNYGNLFIATINAGIKKIIRNNYPIKYFGEEKSTDNFVLSVLPDKSNNRVVVGTAGNGLKVYDTLQRLIKHFPNGPGTDIAFSPTIVVKDPKGNYLLFVWGEKELWKLDRDLSGITKMPIRPLAGNAVKGVAYFSNILYQNEREVVVQTQSLIYKVNFMDGTCTEIQFSASSPMSGLLYRNTFLTHFNDELVFMDTISFKPLKVIPFPNTGDVRCFASDEKGNIYFGANKGIFKIDSSGKTISHFSKQSGLPDECIYAVAPDRFGNIWCSTNKGILRINKDNGIFQIKKEDGLQENEFNTNVVATAPDGELFFGGVNGVSSFLPAAITPFHETINIIITAIKINNSDIYRNMAVWNVKEIRLPHNENSISFDFIAMANNNPGQYVYQYKMDGLDEEWIQNEDLQTVRYFLPPGKYTFKIYASRFFDRKAAALKEISIVINPPFWKSWWFLSILAIATISSIAFFTSQYNRRRYRKRLAELESERKVQAERERMSRDLHDSIGAYANAVIYNTELLEKEDSAPSRDLLMKDLKFASKDIITALRETIWALKKDNFSAEDCLVRIRNFIQPFNKYYGHLQFRVEGEAPPGLILHYTRSLHLVRIIQEAVTNSIKYSDAKLILVRSSYAGNKWKLIVQDDGIGFDLASALESQAGNGLNNMLQRAKESSFEFNINSKPGHGTMITIGVQA